MRLLFLTAIALLVGSSPAFAHRLNVRPTVIGDQIRVEAFYEDDTPAQEARVTVALSDEIIAEGRTDEKGVWTCACPKPGTYTVRAESVGHAAKETLVIKEGEEQPTPATDERARLTRTPWGRLAAGVGVIGGLWLAWLVARRAMTKANATGPE